MGGRVHREGRRLDKRYHHADLLLIQLAAADEAAGDVSGWDLYLYGDNELLLNESCPATEPLDDVFYNDILKAAEEQERGIGEYPVL